MSKVLVIITGGPGTGKSYMTNEILEHVKGLTVLSFDEIKEKNFDRFGYDNDEQKTVLNEFSLEEFYLQLQKYMWENKNILVEYPFYQRHKPRLQQLIDTYEYKTITVYLYGDLKTIYDRGAKRDSYDARHPGHLTTSYHKENYIPDKKNHDVNISFEQFCQMMEQKNYDIQLGTTLGVDVTDIVSIPYNKVIEKIQKVCI